MEVNLNNMQRQTINSYNSVINLLNKCKPDEWGKIEVNANELANELRDLHNNLAFVGGLIDPKTQQSYWDVKPDADIKSLEWDED